MKVNLFYDFLLHYACRLNAKSQQPFILNGKSRMSFLRNEWFGYSVLYGKSHGCGRGGFILDSMCGTRWATKIVTDKLSSSYFALMK